MRGWRRRKNFKKRRPGASRRPARRPPSCMRCCARRGNRSMRRREPISSRASGMISAGVRVHTDAAAEQSARDINAHAYTVGHNMVFDAGRFAPGTHEGRRLLAHELTHVVQQSGSDGIRVDRTAEKRGPSPISQRCAQTLVASRPRWSTRLRRYTLPRMRLPKTVNSPRSSTPWKSSTPRSWSNAVRRPSLARQALLATNSDCNC